MHDGMMFEKAVRMLNKVTGDSIIQIFTGNSQDEINAQILEHLVEDAKERGIYKALGLSPEEVELIERLTQKEETKAKKEETKAKKEENKEVKKSSGLGEFASFIESLCKSSKNEEADAEDEDDDDEDDEIDDYDEIDNYDDDDYDDEDEEDDDPVAYKCHCGSCDCHKSEVRTAKFYKLYDVGKDNLGNFFRKYQDKDGNVLVFID